MELASRQPALPWFPTGHRPVSDQGADGIQTLGIAARARFITAAMLVQMPWSSHSFC